MSADQIITETQLLEPFDRIRLKDHTGAVELFIAQGSEESLTIQASQEIVQKIKTGVRRGQLDIQIGGTFAEKVTDMFKTTLAHERIRLTLTVKTLNALEVFGAAKINASSIKTGLLILRIHSAGDVTFKSLTARVLRVEHSGAGILELTGKAVEQGITLNGAGSYRAPKLESQKANVLVEGTGNVTIWAVRDLKATVRGIGSVIYYGNPSVKRRVSGLGSVINLGGR
ncbi:MAG: hypothetical protein GTO18_22255 [Anaerolineales bacterium]|nr:hypothetical protein [Anaerolineales bacterium]